VRTAHEGYWLLLLVTETHVTDNFLGSVLAAGSRSPGPIARDRLPAVHSDWLACGWSVTENYW